MGAADPILAALQAYLRAGASFDLVALERFYAPDFCNIRTWPDGTTITITRAEMVARLHQLADTGRRLPPADDVQILATTTFLPFGSVVFHRVKDGRPFVYNFVWDLRGSEPRLLREFTTAVTAAAPGSRSPS